MKAIKLPALAASLLFFLTTNSLAQEVSMPGVEVKNGSIKAPGVSIDKNGITAPGVRVDSSGVRTQSTRVSRDGISVQGSSAVKTGTSSVGGGAGQVFTDTNSRRGDFRGQDLTGAIFTRGDFSRSDFSGANLSGAVFSNVNFSRAKFVGACMMGVTVTGGDFSRTKWDGAITTGMTRSGGDFSRSSIGEADSVAADCSSLGFKTSSVQIEKNSIAVVQNTEIQKTEVSKVEIEKAELQKVPEAKEPRKFRKATEISKALSKTNSRIDLTVNFDYDSDRIQSEAHSQVLEVANSLKSEQLKNARVRIEGHTDHDGSDDYNMDLSYRRAVSVATALSEKYGIGLDRLQVKGFGESQPVANNSTDLGKALNRRVTIVRLR